MNINEVKKHVTFELVLIICTIICFLLSLYVILFTDIGVKAYSETIFSSYVTPGQACSLSNPSQHTGEVCVLSPNASEGDAEPLEIYPSPISFGYSNIYAFQFYTNYPIRGYSYNTLKITGTNFANVPYTCNLSNFTSSCKVNYVSSTQLNVNFTSNVSNNTSQLQVEVRGANGSVIATNGNWKINGIYYLQNDMGDDDIINSGGTPPPSGGTSSTNQDIINNQTDNTNQIINNDNENTEQITNTVNSGFTLIDNAINLVNQSLHDFLATCEYNYLNINNWASGTSRYNIEQDYDNYNFTLTALGNYTGGTFPLMFAVNLEPNTTYYFKSFHSIVTSNNTKGMYYIYKDNRSTSGGTLFDYTENLDNFSFTTGSSTKYYFQLYVTGSQSAGDKIYWQKPAIYKTNYTGNFVPYNKPNCTSGIDRLNDTSNQINNYLQDNSDPSIDTTALDGVLQNVDYHNPLDYLLTLPFHLIQKINTLLSQNSCDRISFGQLLGTELYLPCINIQSYLGSSLFNTIDIFMAVGLLVVTLKKFYDSISNIITLGKEKEVKDKLELPTPMEFLSMILGGRD